MQQHESELRDLEMAVCVVTFEESVVARNYAKEARLPWPILLDDSRSLYQAYGMERGGAWTIYGPASWPQYIKLMLKGRKLKLPTGDVHQLGGDVLIDPNGVVRRHFVSQSPTDRPSVESLIDVVRQRDADAGEEPPEAAGEKPETQ